MSDRVPLSQVETLDHPDKNAVQDTNPGFNAAPTTGIDELKEMKDLSLMLGYDGDGFDGDYEKAMKIYEWGKQMAQFSDLKNPLLEIKNFTRAMGINSTKKALLNKLYLLTMMDTTKGYLYK
jgi:hypothetical protein